MHLLRGGTISVQNIDVSRSNYEQWLDYQCIEQGTIDTELAESWGANNTTGARYNILQPSSKANIFIRLIEAPPVAEFIPLRSYGWAALEICVQDVLAVNNTMADSPFEIIGPPRKIEGLDAIHPMQVRGPDDEVLYFTQINDDIPPNKLPRAQSLIDHLFINVLAASDLSATRQWLTNDLITQITTSEMDIVYTMLANAFTTPIDQKYTIATVVHDQDVFLEADQLPAAATPRPKHDGMLPPGIAMTTLHVPSLQDIKAKPIQPPSTHPSAMYQGAMSMTVTDPDGALFELVEINS